MGFVILHDSHLKMVQVVHKVPSQSAMFFFWQQTQVFSPMQPTRWYKMGIMQVPSTNKGKKIPQAI